jgi:8-oxo-dGTP pyrophosphatase MutT (NUDIX family)
MTTDIDKLAWLHVRNKRLLFARSIGKATWYIPGGKREPGESDHEALAREISEELSVDLVPATMSLVGEFRAQADGKPQGTLVRMTCYEADFSGDIVPAAEIEEVAWLGHTHRDECSPVARLVLDHLKQAGSID